MQEKQQKKRYAPPRLQVHGRLRDLTRTAGDNSKDGGANSVHSRT